MTALYNWLVAFANWLFGLFQSVLDWLLAVLDWLLDYVGYLAYSLFETLLAGLVSALEAIPRPDVFATVQSEFCSNFSALGYAAGNIDIGGPLTLIFSAYVLRFVIRRLPVIG